MRFSGSPIVTVKKALRRKPAQQQPVPGPILPVELLEPIFVFACEEDGAAARSLSVVCKTAHSIAKYAARFDTVTLRSGTEREVRRCVSLLSEARAATATRREWVARPVVRHLCVLLTPTEAWRVQYHSLRQHGVYHDTSRVYTKTVNIRDGLNDAIHVLFPQVAPDLETLCTLRIPGDVEDTLLLPSVIDTIRYGRGFWGFPKLRDLSFVGNLWFEPSQDRGRTDDEADDGSSRDSNAPLFPALKRIHMAPCLGSQITPVDRWTKEAPALESLRYTVSAGKEADQLKFGTTISQNLSKLGGTRARSPESTGPTDPNASSLRFVNLKEVVVVTTRSLAPSGNRDGDRKPRLTRRIIERISTTPKAEPDPHSSTLYPYPLFQRDDRFHATEQYVDRDWRERVTDPAGDGIDLYEFSQEFRRNVTVYRTNLQG
ncbi:hypothetical protein LXA43DRAFT_331678 [Ganoderma leucocontextum]|nr:hypothetical protein LXA43DRAFT_331678 [Ganoderma leucocontextum]